MDAGALTVDEIRKSSLQAQIVAHHRVAPETGLLILHAPEICLSARPGQFVHIRCGSTLDPLLRRPLSIHAVQREKGLLALLYRVVGRGTRLLAAARPGERLDVLGPLGRGFDPPGAGRPVALVAGGIGAAPLFFLLQELAERGAGGHLLIGARSREQLSVGRGAAGTGILQAHHFTVPVLAESDPRRNRPMPAAAPGRWVLHQATDDGSCGHHGPVTDLLLPLLQGRRVEAVYACGPRPMLRAVCALLARYDTPGQISLEERMGCGVGACLACACKTAAGDGAAYRRVCVDGPVFDARAVLWDDGR